MNKDETLPYLKSLWTPTVNKKTGNKSFSRVTRLIVPVPSWDEAAGTGDLNNSDWAYEVPYTFRTSLDLSLDTRRKQVDVLDSETGDPVIDEETNKVKRKSHPYQIWTQGFIIDFKEGDLLISNKGFPALQVQSSRPMDWVEEENKVFEGEVNYELFDTMKFGHLGNIKTVSQMEFLEILIHGYPDTGA